MTFAIAAMSATLLAAAMVVGLPVRGATAMAASDSAVAAPSAVADPENPATDGPQPTDDPGIPPTETPDETVTPTPTPTEPTAPTVPPETPTPTPTATTGSPSPTTSGTSTGLSSPPASQNSPIPLAEVAFAVAVILVALVLLWLLHRRSLRRRTAPGPAGPGPGPVRQEIPPVPGVPDVTAPRPPSIPPAPGTPGAEAGIVAFLVALGEAMIDSGDPVTHVTDSLERIAAVNDVPDAEIVVMATALLVSVRGQEVVQTAVAAAGRAPLRLDQIDEVFQIVADAERGEVSPVEGLVRLQRTREQKAPFRRWTRVAGYMGLSAGLALILRADWVDLIIAAVLGVAVGALLVAASRMKSAFRAFLPVTCAFAVTVVVFVLARYGLDTGGLAPIAAPLVTFLPGALLTTSVIELSTGQMISGAGRLAAGTMQLVLLALGIVAGAQLVGVPAADVANGTGLPLSPIAPWIGVAVFGMGVVVYNCARWVSVGWILLVLYVAYAGQVVGGLFFGGVLSAFFGALLMTPVAMFAATQRTGPPTLVSFLPAFWMLVPGSLGLVGVTKFLGNDPIDGIDSLVTAGGTMVSITLGVLLGLGLGAALASFLSRMGLAERDASVI